MGRQNKSLLCFEKGGPTPPQSSHLEIKQLQLFWSFSAGCVFSPSDRSLCSLLLFPVNNIPDTCPDRGAALKPAASPVMNTAGGLLHLSHRAVSCCTPNMFAFSPHQEWLGWLTLLVLSWRAVVLWNRLSYLSGPSLASVCPPCSCHIWFAALESGSLHPF